MCIVLRREQSSPYSSEYAIGTLLNRNEGSTMGDHLNAGAVDGRRTWDILTIGLFTLVTSSGLIGVPLFGYIHGYTKLDWALAGVLYLISGLGCFMLAGAGRIFLVLNSTFCINSVCHLWGSQPYSRSNSSRDSWWVSLITLGEGYHNYHHTFPRDYRNGPLRYNVDPSKWVIYALSKLGLAKGLVRCDSGSRVRMRLHTSLAEGLETLPEKTPQLRI